MARVVASEAVVVVILSPTTAPRDRDRSRISRAAYGTADAAGSGSLPPAAHRESSDSLGSENRRSTNVRCQNRKPAPMLKRNASASAVLKNRT